MKNRVAQANVDGQLRSRDPESPLTVIAKGEGTPLVSLDDFNQWLLCKRSATLTRVISLPLFQGGQKGIITMDMLGKKGRLRSRDRLSIRGIVQRTGLSKNTVKSRLKAGEASIADYPAPRGD